MIAALCLLLGCELAGEALRLALSLPAPGPVIGMILLAAILVVGDRLRPRGAKPPPLIGDVQTASDALIRNMGLLFVPAGVGVISQASLLQAEWLPIVVGVLGSTLIGLVVTAGVLHFALPKSDEEEAAEPRRCASNDA